jgi:acetyl-CoA C-acetyltransferase
MLVHRDRIKLLGPPEEAVMEDAVVVSAVRTPVGSFGGQFKDVAATELGAHAVRAALERAGIAGAEVDEVVLGCVLQAGLGQNAARQAAIGAGIPKEVPATTINMVCGSGLKAVAIASQMIRAGDVDIVVAGGMENMTRAPYLIPSGRFGARMGDAELIDSMVHDGLWDAFNDIHMGITAENLADQYDISREEQDEFAASSQQKAERAVTDGIFSDEIVPIELPAKGGARLVDSDEAPRAGTTADTLGKLRTAFRRDGGTVTAGNASGINDGAAAIVVMSASKANERGLRTFGTVESYASVGVEPRIMGIGPVPAVRKALARAGLQLGDIDLFELNEAFAAQSLAVLRELDIDRARINPHGGAIALGHPVGASGGRILVTLLHEMRRRDARRGLAALCVGGGQGQAAIIRNGVRH